jgi:ubiquinone/menaquinone biosynthesis C-methylase UbiE
MPQAQIDNIVGHQMKYDHLSANVPAAEVGALFVGGGDPVLVGYQEMDIIHVYGKISGASIVDVGCGIGRLARNLVVQDIGNYLGLDVIQPILEEAVAVIGSDKRFRFEIVADCKIPMQDAKADVVVGFSTITHLIDEEIYDYFCESKRVLAASGVAIFSFFDFLNSRHLEIFFKHAAVHRQGHGDMLKFNTKEVLARFANAAGFRVVDFLDGGTDIPNSRIPSSLLDVRAMPDAFQFGQSLCIMRV